MLIGIDGNEANVGERVGVNVWAVELLWQFKRMRDKGQGIKEDTKFVVYLFQKPLSDMPPETESWQYRVIGPGRFWTRWRLPLDLYVHQPRPDVFLSLSHYTPQFSPMPTVMSIMDVSFLKFPEAFKPAVRWQLADWTRASVRKATHIIAISEFTKKEIVREYKVSPDKITVVFPGVSEVFKGFTLRQGETFSDIKYKYGINDKYLLFVGTLQPKKNLPRLLEAFKLVKQKYSDVELAVAGKVWNQFAATAGKQVSGVKYLGYVPEEDLPGLMAGAEALVLPSLYEGFGIPVIEAMSVGTPVIVSHTTGLPEIVGDAGILCDPMRVESIAEAISRLLTLPNHARHQIIEKGKIRSRKFNWSQAVIDILSVLKKVVQNER